MKLNISNIKLSTFDLKRGLTLPDKMTSELAEDIGIMIGDGNLARRIRKGRVDYEVGCGGDLLDEKYYYKNYITNLKYKLFNVKFTLRERPKISTCELRINSKGLLEFYSSVIGLPIGKKKNIAIPNILSKEKMFLASCIRGIGDTDFSLVFKRKNDLYPYYPVIKICSMSKPLVKSLEQSLKMLGLKPTLSCDIRLLDKRTGRIYTSHSLDLNGKDNLETWMKKIGFSNPKNNIKYRFWKENGFGPSQEQIMKILYGGPDGIRTHLELSHDSQVRSTAR